MVKQVEIAQYAKIKAAIEAMEIEANEIRARLIQAHRSGEVVQDGRLILKVTINDEAERTAWKPVVEAISANHPELRGGIASIIKANTAVQPYEQVRILTR